MVVVAIGGVRGDSSDTNCQLGEKNKQNRHLKILSQPSQRGPVGNGFLTMMKL